jgi:glycosyltransferase involved in cell wall biosynthesis
MFRTTDPSVSVVMPAQDEADNLEIVLGELPAVDEVVLVDGHSADSTVEVAAGVRPGITVVEQTRTGKGNALACGLESARGDVVVMLDADGSADPGEIPAFVEALASGPTSRWERAFTARAVATTSPPCAGWATVH